MSGIFSHIYFVAFVQSLFFVSIILLKRERAVYNYFLVFILFLIGLECLFTYLHAEYEIKSQIITSIASIATWTLLGPTLFLYFEYLRKPFERFHLKDLVHFLPFVIALGFSIKIFEGYSNKSIYYIFSELDLNLFESVAKVLWTYTTLFYFIFILYLFRKHKRNLNLFFANYSNVDLKWIKFLTIYFAVFLFFELITIPILELKLFSLSLYVYYTFSIVLLFFVFGIGYFGFKQNNVFNAQQIKLDEYKKILEYSSNDSINTKYKTSNLNDTDKEILKERLLNLINKEKNYLDPEITISKLAELLDVSVHKLSQLLNESFNQSFYNFINTYRVEEVRKKLNDESWNNFTILAIAYECGFNSKTAFYNTFKKITKITPTEYRKAIIQSSSECNSRD